MDVEKTNEDSMEMMSTALSQLFEIRQNHFFDSPALSESFINEFEVFQADKDLQHNLARIASFLTGVKIGIVHMDGMYTNELLDILLEKVLILCHRSHWNFHPRPT
jgi:hypothetical protein